MASTFVGMVCRQVRRYQNGRRMWRSTVSLLHREVHVLCWNAFTNVTRGSTYTNFELVKTCLTRKYPPLDSASPLSVSSGRSSGRSSMDIRRDIRPRAPGVFRYLIHVYTTGFWTCQRHCRGTGFVERTTKHHETTFRHLKGDR